MGTYNSVIEKKQVVEKLYFNLPQSPIKKIFFFPSSRIPSPSAKYNGEHKGHLWNRLKPKRNKATQRKKPQTTTKSIHRVFPHEDYHNILNIVTDKLLPLPS